MTSEHTAPGFRVRQVHVNGGHPWVLEDAAGILEMAESTDVLAEDHPEADITITGTLGDHDDD
jgi:hypothetical protein